MPELGIEDEQSTTAVADSAIGESPVAPASADGRPVRGAEGLTQDEATRRLEEVGPNELVEHRQSGLRRFLASFWGPIPWMIEAAALLSAGVQHWADFAIIGVLLVFNAVVGFWEEYQAGNAIEALQARLAPNARVRRDGAWRVIPARELVPDDLIRLRLGDIVPADATL